jgi:hypothetical protein
MYLSTDISLSALLIKKEERLVLLLCTLLGLYFSERKTVDSQRYRALAIPQPLYDEIIMVLIWLLFLCLYDGISSV